MLDKVTPLILTFDEMPNLQRTLAALDWAKRIVVVDSGSRDGTLELLQSHPRVALYGRPFDGFASQSEYGLRETGVETDWVLSLDADHVLTPGLVEELRRLDLPTEVDGLRARFAYCIQGRRLRGSLYPPRVVLARRQAARYVQDGHAHRMVVPGKVLDLVHPILHDDRKPRLRWLQEQSRYAALEAEKLVSSVPADLSLADRVRRSVWVAPWLVPLYCLTVKRGLLDGRAGWIYAGERSVAEWMLSLAICERLLRR